MNHHKQAVTALWYCFKCQMTTVHDKTVEHAGTSFITFFACQVCGTKFHLDQIKSPSWYRAWRERWKK